MARAFGRNAATVARGQWLGAGVQDWLLAAPWSLSLIASLLWGLTGLGLGRLLLMVLMRLSWAWMPGVLAMLVAAIVHTLYQSMFTRRRPQTSFNRLALLGGFCWVLAFRNDLG